MSDLTAFIAQAWQEHTDDARGVADRLPQALVMVVDESGILSLLNLAHHVHGEHLGSWQEGLKLLSQLDALPGYAPLGDSGLACQRAVASLRLSAALGDDRAGLTPSDRIRVSAMAAANLAALDTARAMALFDEARALAQGAALPDSDPMNRAMAVTGHNLAASLEQMAERSPAETELMLSAAESSRHFWAKAGSWLEAERAEYRLVMSCLQAGLLQRARGHAQQCLAIVQAHDDVALEQFFGFEALALVERAACEPAAFDQALARARAAFTRLSEDDRSWCQASLDKLGAATSAPP